MLPSDQKLKNKIFYRPFALIILDGFGIAPPGPGNAVTLAKMPFWRSLLERYPHTELTAHGEAVGLFPDADGNSEAGHINLGAGRIVKQDLVAISERIDDGTFFKNTAFIEAINHVKKHKSNLHLMGLLTGKNSAHAYPDHVDKLIKLCRSQKIKQVFLHLFTDGRDSRPYEGYDFLHELLKKLDPAREFAATIIGRFYAMDRKKEWGRTAAAYHSLTVDDKCRVDDPLRAIENGYARGESDEFIRPTVICRHGKKIILPRVSDHDAVIFFNARSDRARQLTKAFIQDNFNQANPGAFKRKKVLKDIIFVALTDFGPDLPHLLTAYPSPDLKATLPMELSDLRQLYIAETDKYGHMTYFFNGGYAEPVGGEDRILIKSPEVRSYDLSPAMSAEAVTDMIIQNSAAEIYDFFGVNYANPDMLGHTGHLTAAIKSLEFLDQCLKRVVNQLVLKQKGIIVLVADHGNCEEMIDIKSGQIDTEHSTNPVPFVVVGPDELVRKIKLRSGGILADVAPTVLRLLKRDQPGEMTGKSLIM